MLEEFIRGEGKNVEFKVSLPKKSENYIKTIIAFANCRGGKLIIGVDDKTREVKLSQPMKALLPILVTDSGIIMLVRLVQP